MKVIAQLSEISDGGSLRKTYEGQDLAIFLRGHSVYVVSADCPHRGGPLEEGETDDECILTCPWHGWRFDLRSGKSPTHPGEIKVWNASIIEGQIVIE